ncbi:hypothetical protein [Streptomyces sp. CAU 1734]|uniref:hypothetical protein n=1 Tax=Streptomyces sp. CAU 1734 TaxID=3140360 RepID=UPI00326027B7
MARRYVGDDEELFRVIVVRRQMRENPDWDRGRGGERTLYDGPEYTSVYGPYNSLSAARGQLTGHTRGYGGVLLQGVVSGRIQTGSIEWSDVA